MMWIKGTLNELHGMQTRCRMPFLLGLTFLFSQGCGNGNAVDRSAPSAPDPVAVSGAVVLQDNRQDRLLFLTAADPRSLVVERVSAGKNIAEMLPSRDGQQLFVLSRGVFPRLTEADEGPGLTIYDGAPETSGEGRRLRRFALDDPMENLALDPRGEWVAAYGGDSSVVNPNELVLFDLTSEDEIPTSKTIRSFGGAPEELLFTDELAIPEGNPRRFLVVRTDRDLTLVDLADLEGREKTVKLPQDPAGDSFPPEQVVYDDGDPDDPTDARLAVRLGGTADVVLVELGEPAAQGQPFSIVVNIVDVGGVPSSIDFVRTDGGLRLAALVPERRRAVLVDPETTLAELVDLPEVFTNMRRMEAGVAASPDGSDVALLWGASNHIAFLSLGTTSATPYRSVDTAELTFAVQQVLDVPPPNEHLKVLTGGGSDVFVLDLESRQSSPLNTQFQAGAVRLAPDGERLWVFQRSGHLFSAVHLSDLHPQALYAEPGVSEVFDIERIGGGRAAVILHLEDGWSATLMDAEQPDTAKMKHHPGLDLEGLL